MSFRNGAWHYTDYKTDYKYIKLNKTDYKRKYIKLEGSRTVLLKYFFQKITKK